MALPSSGNISFGAINVELGSSTSTQLSIGGATTRALAGVASGAIRVAADFYGKSNIKGGNYMLVSILATTNNRSFYIFNFSSSSGLGSFVASYNTLTNIIPNGLSFSPDNSKITAGQQGGSNVMSIYSFNGSAVGFLASYTLGSFSSVFRSVWNPTGAYWVSTGYSALGGFALWSYNGSAITFVTGYSSSGGGLTDADWQAIDSNNDWLVTSNSNINMYVHKRTGGTITYITSYSWGTNGQTSRFSPNGNYIAATHNPSGGNVITVFSFNKSTGAISRITGYAGSAASGLKWHPSGNYFITFDGGVTNGLIRVFSFNGSTITQSTTYAPPGGMTAGQQGNIAMHPSGNYIGATHASSPFFSLYNYTAGGSITLNTTYNTGVQGTVIFN
jgi:hypothetical protein